MEPSLAGPRRPQDRVTLGQMKSAFDSVLPTFISAPSSRGGTAVAEKVAARKALVTVEGQQVEIGDGAVSIAAITSCTNTTNPSVMVGAGLLAKHAVERGLQDQAMGQNESGTGLNRGDGLSPEGWPVDVSQPAQIQPGWLWLYHLHRQQRIRC